MNGTSVPGSHDNLLRARWSTLLALAWVLAHAVACGKTEFADGVVAPTSNAPVCEQTIRPSVQSVPATGGSFVVEITTGAGCEWTVQSDDTWITVTSGSGSGPGSAAYVVRGNAQSNVRQGRVRVGNLAVSVTQAATDTPGIVEPVPPPTPAPVPPAPEDCHLTVSPASVTMADSSGTTEIVVTTGSRCRWEATTDAEWVSIASTSGVGPARVRLDLAANAGLVSRSATVRIGEAAVRVTQSPRTTPSCEAIRLDPETQTSPVDGGSFRVVVSAPVDCTWTAVSDSWIAVSPRSGSGNASLSYTVATNDALPRSGTIRVGSAIVKVTQDGCSLTLSQASRDVGADGGRFSVEVTATGTACTWTPSTGDAWIQVLSPPWRGTGTLSFAVAANSSGPRTGRIRIGEQSIEVRQAGAAAPAPCPESVSPASASFPATGGESKFSITATADCKWSASADMGWITITSGTGAGSSTGLYSVRPNDGPERSGRIRIGDRAIEIRQAAAPPRSCPESVAPSSFSAPASGSDGKFSVTAAPACKWSASANVAWIVTTSGGAGNGAGTYSVVANTGPTRSGLIRVGDQAITVTQAAAPGEPACTYSIDLAPGTLNPKGDTLTIVVTTQARCPWNMKTEVDWIEPRSASGTGSSKVGAKVQPNSGRPREATIIVNDRSFTVRQSGL